MTSAVDTSGDRRRSRQGGPQAGLRVDAIIMRQHTPRAEARQSTPTLDDAGASAGSSLPLAHALALLAVAKPRVRWTPYLNLALTAGCLLDLARAGEVVCDRTDKLHANGHRGGLGRAHELLVRRIASNQGRELIACLFQDRLDVVRKLFGDVERQRLLQGDTRRLQNLGFPRYQVVDLAALVEVQEKVLHVYARESNDWLGSAVVAVAAAASLPRLLPNCPSRSKLRSRARQLPPSRIVDGLAVAVTAISRPIAMGG